MGGAGAWPLASARRATGGVRADSAPLVRIQHPLMTSVEANRSEGRQARHVARHVNGRTEELWNFDSF